MPTTATKPSAVIEGVLDTQSFSRAKPHAEPPMGWDGPIYVARDQERSFAVVESWHNDTHPGVFRFCDEQPCQSLNVGVSW